MSELFNSENIIRLDTVNSTNSYAHELIKNNKAPEGTIIVANEQTTGKGQGKAKWESEAGKNLTISIILHPNFLSPEKQFQLNKCVALGIKDFVNSVFSKDAVYIKWPNDIYIEKKKVAGILIVNSIIGNLFEHAVIGIGINVNQRNFISDAPNPVSFRMLSGEEYDLEVALEELCFNFNKRYDQLINNETSSIDHDYLGALYQLNSWKNYKYKGKLIEAMITGVSEYGRLVLSTRSTKEIECDVKEISFL